ncbi:hypothetical protein C7974DRAFT_36558 [Boeremia exigua]|uniref:uncharacterized protein n=1 Tax=Boeremia exigua TaxID=749465 RepID=UPI001E8E0ECB|nr:uncharacterized protein C7974DRAFT_36558 [Boeremia exigua]KAH6618749.1 hypothetical protein C7974DRAFT_36558 [Boeremia exigua]
MARDSESTSTATSISMSSQTPTSTLAPTDSTSKATAKAKVKASPAYLKRREQVRRAQRAHRDRKEGYVRALEAEDLALRVQLRAWDEVASIGGGSGEGGGLSTVGEVWVEGLDCAGTEAIEVAPRIEAIEDVSAAGNAVVWQSACSWSTSVGRADMAMEFVLALEKPCVQRAQSVVFDPLDAFPMQHAKSSAELALYHTFVNEELGTPMPCSHADVAGSLDHLFLLSSAFCLENEVTPVQAWQHLCRYFEFGVVDSKGLKTLIDALLEHVRCYGFGAVVSKSALDEACRRVFT